jgi:hypothetical protein
MRLDAASVTPWKPPEPWLKETLFRQAAKQARAASDQMREGSKAPKGGSSKKGKL